ncbi:protein-disulfide reductase DsbD family protein [Sanyastnella coralliicola]|uniref:protein-disulfide reductase DsbD family protein n=1 Tax=Sanyastnella coralliicola TaxID=3069118 RepID=UPI0027B99B50|nr:thioredoxin family protein [Longitalea sp. SCSIO 12813]
MLKLKATFGLLASLLLISWSGFAQIEEPVTWDLSIEKKANNEFELVAKASIEAKWHVYASVISDDPDAFGPIPTTVVFKDTLGFTTIGSLKEGEHITHYDPNFEMDLNYFEDEVEFRQGFKFEGQSAEIEGQLDYMACDDSKCIFPDPIYFTLIFNEGDLAYAGTDDGGIYGKKPEPEIYEPAKWNFSSMDNGDGTHTIKMVCNLDEGWHLYSQHLDNNEGPVPTSFIFTLPDSYATVGETEEETPIVHYDPNFMMDLAYFEGSPVFLQKIKVDGDLATITAGVDFMVCNDEMCLPPELVEFNVNLATGMGQPVGYEGEEGVTADDLLPALPMVNLDNPEGSCGAESSINEVKSNKGIWNVFLLGFFGGLIALLTPCVFPMIPLTVSFFTKGGQEKGSGIRKALLYGFFIALIYVLLSVPFHFGTDPETLNLIATSAWLNLIFFVLFVVFAISFFGYFEITLPNGLLNKADSASNVGGLAGIFFMALTLALVSFSCTGPILGTVLGNALKNGPWPITAAMAGFGVALGLPFTLFAAFPSVLNSMPKSGGWLNSVKVVLGFVELALAVKFLSNADLVYQWGILERETFFLIWAIIGLGLTLYLLGVLKFPHDSPIKKFSLFRVGFVALVAAFTIYVAPGVLQSPPWNHNLLSGFPPPSFYSWYAGDSHDGDHEGIHPEFMDFDEAMAHAKEVNKPLLVDFTGWACVNCRKMEETVWTDPTVAETIKNDFVLVSLYVDDKNSLPEEKQGVFTFESTGKTKRIRTIGNKWATFQNHYFNNNSQPYYVMLSPDGELLGNPVGYTPDVSEYQSYLECGVETNNKLSGNTESSQFAAE